MQLSVTPLRDQIAAPARTILLVLLAAAGVVFVIACSNVANLILARSVRREGELAVRAALGASRGALRRTLLAESLVLCGAGAVLGVLLARPLVARGRRAMPRASRCARSTSRVDASLLWVGAGLAMAAAVLLAYVPAAAVVAHGARPGSGLRPSGSGVRITPGTNRRLRVFAIDADRVLVRAARRRGHAARHAGRAADARTPATTCGRCWRSICRCRSTRRRRREGDRRSIQEVTRRIGAAARRGAASPSGSFVPWRDAGSFGPGVPVRRRGLHAGERRREPARAAAHRRARLLRRRSAFRCSPAATSPTTTAAAASRW